SYRLRACLRMEDFGFKFSKRRQLLSACTTKRFPSPRCASATNIVRPFEPTLDTHPQLQPALLRLSAMISQYFTHQDSASFALYIAMTKQGVVILTCLRISDLILTTRPKCPPHEIRISQAVAEEANCCSNFMEAQFHSATITRSCSRI